MVCQSASQTRFRALKYENGIAGKPTIVVKVIACFQPPQNCQAEYFRQLLKPVIVFCWMVKTGDSWPQSGHSAENLPKFDCMNELLNLRLRCLNRDTCISSAQMEFWGSSIQQAGLNSEPRNGLPYGSPSYSRTMRPNVLPCLLKKQYDSSLELAQIALPGSNTEFSKRKFIIFDQSGNQTSVMYSSGSAQIPLSISAKNCSHGLNDDDEEEEAARDFDIKSYLYHKSPSINGIVAGEESEMHEDTEEINALLYSDDDNHCSSDDEVTSTGHSPPLIKELYDKQIEEMNEEVASSDGPRKRQRLVDGRHKNLSDAPFSKKVDAFNNYEVDTKSSYSGDDSQGHLMDYGSGKFSSKQDKLRETLKLLESMVPGAEGKPPMLVIDDAIDYLKSLKFKAKAMGLAATLPRSDVGQGCQDGKAKVASKDFFPE
ncbi:Transcription factor bHLH, partial [Cucurbita argyrosperma subsp. argyrosperma]